MKNREEHVTFVGADRLVKGMLQWSTKVIIFVRVRASTCTNCMKLPFDQ